MRAVSYWCWRACLASYYPVVVRVVLVVQGYTTMRIVTTLTIATALADIITITIDIDDQHVDQHVEDKEAHRRGY